LAPGISPTNAVVKLYTGFISIAMLTGMSMFQAYILQEHLGIPRGQQGSTAGDLTFWAEVVTFLLFTPFGILSDRIGRRPIYVVGVLMIGLGFGLYPFAESIGELYVYRLIMAVGTAAAIGMAGTITNDYPTETSRGKLIGVHSMLNILGTMFAGGVLGQIPQFARARGYDAETAGAMLFLTAAALCAITAVIAQMGLKGGTVVARDQQESTRKLALAGLRAMSNVRICLSYAGAFASRSDLVIKGLFLTLWAVHDGSERGLTAAQAMAGWAIVVLSMNAANFVAAPLFGWLLDRINRVTGSIIALGVASLGYMSMGIITSPLDYAMIPFFILLAFGSGFMIKASMTLVGQEAAPQERGAVMAANAMFGAVGVMVFTKLGGNIFDSWGPAWIFVIAGAYQGVLFLWAIWIRIFAPGPDVVRQPLPWASKPVPATLGAAATRSDRLPQ
jgi:MFS family permease